MKASSPNSFAITCHGQQKQQQRFIHWQNTREMIVTAFVVVSCIEVSMAEAPGFCLTTTPPSTVLWMLIKMCHQINIKGRLKIEKRGDDYHAFPVVNKVKWNVLVKQKALPFLPCLLLSYTNCHSELHTTPLLSFPSSSCLFFSVSFHSLSTLFWWGDSSSFQTIKTEYLEFRVQSKPFFRSLSSSNHYPDCSDHIRDETWYDCHAMSIHLKQDAMERPFIRLIPRKSSVLETFLFFIFVAFPVNLWG